MRHPKQNEWRKEDRKRSRADRDRERAARAAGATQDGGCGCDDAAGASCDRHAGGGAPAEAVSAPVFVPGGLTTAECLGLDVIRTPGGSSHPHGDGSNLGSEGSAAAIPTGPSGLMAPHGKTQTCSLLNQEVTP